VNDKVVDILHQIIIDAIPNKVYSAITSEQGLRSWWTTDVNGESKEGSILTFGCYMRSVVFTMQIDKLSPYESIKWTCLGDPDEWKDTKLLWELRQNDNSQSTILTFSHNRWHSTEGDYKRCNTTWGHLMILLKGYVEKGTVNPFFN
jgi:uncharacterized protein YndB with AHSA1/START domain